MLRRPFDNKLRKLVHRMGQKLSTNLRAHTRAQASKQPSMQACRRAGMQASRHAPASREISNLTADRLKLKRDFLENLGESAARIDFFNANGYGFAWLGGSSFWLWCPSPKNAMAGPREHKIRFWPVWVATPAHRYVKRLCFQGPWRALRQPSAFKPLFWRALDINFHSQKQLRS